MSSAASTAAVDIYYLQILVESVDQGTSLAAYLNSHGVSAMREDNDVVTCVVDTVGRSRLVRQLHKSWRLFWAHSGQELYGEVVYTKPECESCAECRAMGTH